jgi:hypothetical protein
MKKIFLVIFETNILVSDGHTELFNEWWFTVSTDFLAGGCYLFREPGTRVDSESRFSIFLARILWKMSLASCENIIASLVRLVRCWSRYEISVARLVSRVDTKWCFQFFAKFDYCFLLDVIIAIIATFFTKAIIAISQLSLSI